MSAHSAVDNVLQEGKSLRLLQSEKRVLSQVAAGVPLSKALEELYSLLKQNQTARCLGPFSCSMKKASVSSTAPRPIYPPLIAKPSTA